MYCSGGPFFIIMKLDFLIFQFHFVSGMDQQQGHPFIGAGHQVPLAPSWEDQRHVTEDQLNFRTLSVSMDRLDLEMNPPVDR